MRNALAVILVCLPAFSQGPDGKWVSHTKWFDQDRYNRLELALEGEKLTGTLGRTRISGTFRNGAIDLNGKMGDRETVELHGRLEGDRIAGSGSATSGERKVELTWEARRIPPPAAPRTHTFEPVQFHHHFSEMIEPALQINP